MSRDHGRERGAASDISDPDRRRALERRDPCGPASNDAGISDAFAASAAFGRHLFTRAGSYLGDIVELLLDIATGTVLYAVVVPGGPWGLEKRWPCVPFDLMRYDAEHDAFVLRTSPASLAGANFAGADVRRRVLTSSLERIRARSSPVCVPLSDAALRRDDSTAE